jgi:hypothetical protein
MWYPVSFNDTPLPRGNFVTQMPRVFAQNRLRIPGAVMGDYDLEGIRNRPTQQSYTFEFTVAECDVNTRMDALLGAAQRVGQLRISNSQQTRRATAKVTNAVDATTMDDWRSRQKRVQVQFDAEPFWYADAPTVVPFTSTTTVLLRNSTANLGNARAIKYVVLTITSNITAFVNISINPQTGNYYNEFLYGTKFYTADSFAQSAALTYIGYTSAPLVIDAGNSTVRLGGVDVYANTTKPDTQTALLWLEPGDNRISFSQAVSGSISFRNCWV